MACSGLKGSAVVHECLDGIGRDCACEFLLVCLSSLDCGNCQIFGAEIRIDIQHLLSPCFSLLGAGVDSVAFLPHKLTGAQEGSGLFFPAYNAAPLVIDLGKIAVGLDLSPVKIREQGLGSRTDTGALVKLLGTTVCDPCYFGREAFDQIALLAQKMLRDQQGKIDILYADSFETCVKVLLYSLPDRIACGLVDHESFNI